MYLIIDVSAIQTTAEKLFVSSEATKLLSGGGGGAIFLLCHSAVYIARLFRLSQGQHIVVTFPKTN